VRGIKACCSDKTKTTTKLLKSDKNANKSDSLDFRFSFGLCVPRPKLAFLRLSEHFRFCFFFICLITFVLSEKNKNNKI